MGPIIFHRNVGDEYLEKIAKVEDYLSKSQTNFTSTIFRDPYNGTAYCTIYLGAPRQITQEKFLFFWDVEVKHPSECLAEIRLDMSENSSFTEADIYEEDQNKEKLAPIIEEISRIFGEDLKVQLHKRTAYRSSGCLVGTLPEEELDLLDSTYHHHTKLDIFA
jgi:hypothetical protein